MAMVGVDSGSLYRRTHSLSRLASLGSAAAWRRSTFIKWTEWTLAMALPWWLHHKVLELSLSLSLSILLISYCLLRRRTSTSA